MKQKVIFMTSLLLLLSAGFIFSTYDRADDGVALMSEDDYNCIMDSDNRGVQEFKYNTITTALRNDIKEHELTKEQFLIKQKYFNPCN